MPFRFLTEILTSLETIKCRDKMEQDPMVKAGDREEDLAHAEIKQTPTKQRAG